MVFGAGSDDLLTPDEEGRYWLPLLSGVTAASWNFWDEAGSAWVDEWNDTEKMPVLLAFSFDDYYRPLPLRVVFEVPDQASKPPAAETNATTTNATGGTFPARPSDGQGRPGGGGAGGGGGGEGPGQGSGGGGSKGGVGTGPGGGER